MSEEIVNKIISDEETLKSFFEIHKANIMLEVRKTLLEDLKKQMQEIAKEQDLEFKDKDLGTKEFSGWGFYLNQADYYIYFQLYPFFKCLNYGILNKNRKYDEAHKKRISEYLGKGLGLPLWLWINEFDSNLKNWEKPDAWLAIIDGTMKASIKDKVVLMMGKIKEIER